MNIVLGKENLGLIDKKYIVLELDTMRIPNSTDPITAYCVLEQLPLEEMIIVNQFVDLHHNLMRNYRLQNWKYCKDALEHLNGRWGKTLDSFYVDLFNRINQYQTTPPSTDWDGVLDRSS